MGLDVTAYLLVGVSIDLIYREGKIPIDIIKTDKNGIQYTIEEEKSAFFFLNKLYLEDGEISFHDLLEEKDLEVINDIVGIKILKTQSHRISQDGIPITQEELNGFIYDAVKKFESWGLKPTIYLINNVSY